MERGAAEKLNLNRLPELNCLLSASHTLCLRLRQTGDRLGHDLVLQSKDGLTELVRSVESATGNWPDSPPLQEIVAETHGDSRVLLGIGLASRSHWSSAMQVAARGRHIEFQIACRANDPPGWLGSSYLIGEGCHVDRQDEQRVCIESNQIPFEMVAHNARIEFDADTRKLQIIASMDYENLPATIQWNYSIGIA